MARSPAQAFVVIAHRGDSSAAPENTLASFDAALRAGFLHFETDVQLSADGVPVVLHDEQLGRTNDGAGPAAALSAAALCQLDAGAWFGPAWAGTRIPTLQQVLEAYAGRACIHLELKSQQPALPGAVAGLVRRLGWAPQRAPQRGDPSQQQQQQRRDALALFRAPGLVITSFHLAQLLASKQLLPEVPHGWLVQEVDSAAMAAAQQAGVEMLCPRANALTEAGTRRLLDAGFAVRAWGVKSIELLHHVVACGVHGATVNWPQQAAEALGEKPRIG